MFVLKSSNGKYLGQNGLTEKESEAKVFTNEQLIAFSKIAKNRKPSAAVERVKSMGYTVIDKSEKKEGFELILNSKLNHHHMDLLWCDAIVETDKITKKFNMIYSEYRGYINLPDGIDISDVTKLTLNAIRIMSRCIP